MRNNKTLKVVPSMRRDGLVDLTNFKLTYVDQLKSNDKLHIEKLNEMDYMVQYDPSSYIPFMGTYKELLYLDDYELYIPMRLKDGELVVDTEEKVINSINNGREIHLYNVKGTKIVAVPHNVIDVEIDNSMSITISNNATTFDIEYIVCFLNNMRELTSDKPIKLLGYTLNIDDNFLYLLKQLGYKYISNTGITKIETMTWSDHIEVKTNIIATLKDLMDDVGLTIIGDVDVVECRDIRLVAAILLKDDGSGNASITCEYSHIPLIETEEQHNSRLEQLERRLLKRDH